MTQDQPNPTAQAIKVESIGIMVEYLKLLVTLGTAVMSGLSVFVFSDPGKLSTVQFWSLIAALASMAAMVGCALLSIARTLTLQQSLEMGLSTLPALSPNQTPAEWTKTYRESLFGRYWADAARVSNLGSIFLLISLIALGSFAGSGYFAGSGSPTGALTTTKAFARINFPADGEAPQIREFAVDPATNTLSATLTVGKLVLVCRYDFSTASVSKCEPSKSQTP